MVVHLIAVVLQPHVVTQLVRERTAAAGLAREAESTAEDSDAADVALVEEQMDEVGLGSVAQRMHLVHVTVRRIRETVEIDSVVARLGVRHLGPGHQRHAVIHPALLVGLVGFGDHQVDHGLDRGGAPGGPARSRRIDDGHVDRRRPRPAKGPVEVHRFRRSPPGGRRAPLRHPDIQPGKT